MKKAFLIILICVITNTYAQSANKVVTEDIDNFWIAFDSIQQTNDYTKKLYFINKLYIEKGTKGLKAMMKSKDYTDTLYVKVITEFPDFWKSIRPNTLSVKNKINELNTAIAKLKILYPELRDAEMYFVIGCLGAAGRVTDNMVLIGTELAAGTPATDVSDFKDSWYKNVFAHNSLDNIVRLNIHEYVHTQQKPNSSLLLLSQILKEGSCDFISELVLEKPLHTDYISFGNLNIDKLKKKFQEEMFLKDLDVEANWLYNGLEKKDSADLGYFMGYEICKSYYRRAEDKKKAIKDIIELDYGNDKALELFLLKSGFYKKNIIKQLIKEYEKKLPRIVKTGPFKSGAHDVDAKITEFRITFSKEMISGNVSIDYSEKGKDYFPVKKLIGYENNDKTCVLSIELQPHKEYEFIITNVRFRSKDGYRLKEEKYPVQFRTK